MSLKFLVKSLIRSISFNDHFKRKTVSNMQNAVSKSSPTIRIMCTLVEDFSNYYDYFLRVLEFPDLFGKIF